MFSGLVTPSSIDILLAVKDGEKYLQSQIESILHQDTEMNLVIYCGLDSSTDKSESILIKNGINFFRGHNLGACTNFIGLFEYSNSEFVSLSDQDDVWYPTKLSSAVTMLRGATRPALYVGSLEIDDKKRLVPKERSLLVTILRNEVHGNTFVMNSQLADFIKRFKPKNAVMHDWWIHLVARFMGEIFFDPNPQLRYRIHDNNTIGLISFKEKVRRYVSSLVASGKDHGVYHQSLEMEFFLRTFLDNEDNSNFLFLQKLNLAIGYRFAGRLNFILKSVLRGIDFREFPIYLKLLRGSYLKKNCKLCSKFTS